MKHKIIEDWSLVFGRPRFYVYSTRWLRRLCGSSLVSSHDTLEEAKSAFLEAESSEVIRAKLPRQVWP